MLGSWSGAGCWGGGVGEVVGAVLVIGEVVGAVLVVGEVVGAVLVVREVVGAVLVVGEVVGEVLEQRVGCGGCWSGAGCWGGAGCWSGTGCWGSDSFISTKANNIQVLAFQVIYLLKFLTYSFLQLFNC